MVPILIQTLMHLFYDSSFLRWKNFAINLKMNKIPKSKEVNARLPVWYLNDDEINT